VLLVAYHTIGGSVTGLRLDEDSFWRTFGDGLIYFRMPMFAFLSGVVYAWRPFTGDGTRFLAGKMRRLLLPMLVVGTAFAFFRSTVPGANIPWQNWSTLHIIPDAQYWFSESLFLIFLVVMILESLNFTTAPAWTLGGQLLVSVFSLRTRLLPVSYCDDSFFANLHCGSCKRLKLCNSGSTRLRSAK
jgi:fucose 4-O-acetylase-like acetyltransferase